jgi:hypothetical protein
VGLARGEPLSDGSADAAHSDHVPPWRLVRCNGARRACFRAGERGETGQYWYWLLEPGLLTVQDTGR